MANRIMLNQTSYHGAGAINELPAEVKSRGLKKALICCGKTASHLTAMNFRVIFVF